MFWSTVLIISSLSFFSVHAENVCGDWEPYKEEKCIKLFDKAILQSFADAEKTCAANDSTVINIHFHDEQTFLEQYLFTKKSVVDNVWLGAKSGNAHNVFQWKDGSNFTFTNWAAGNPKNNPSDNCVQMHANEELKGKWSNEPCSKKNLVVCEKEQTWTLKKMQTLLVQTMQNPVPLGFIYVQLPKEKSPQEIWPWMTWTDISPSFNGVFFRVASGNAASFGTVQEEFSPYIDEIKFSESGVHRSSSHTEDAKISRNGGWTGDVLSAYFANGNGAVVYDYLNFHTAAAESVCESGWEVYKEQKCIKLFNTVGLQFFAEAEKTCSENGNSRLVSVNFAEKQTFLVEYLFTKKATVDSVWLGAKYDNVAHRFHWEDSSGGNAKLGLTFTNWAAKNPKNDSLAESCIQMHSEREIRGQWTNEPCSKKNLVLCERAQNWSNAKMQEVIVEMMLNQVPLGFIYVQLPQEKSPQEIWPWMSWSDVSAQFDSTFFRVAGSKAEAFGKTQPEAVPFIDTAEYIDCQQEPRNDCAKLKAEDQYQWVQKIPQSGGWSGRVSTTNFYDFANAHQFRYKASLRFHVTPSEVRPKNMAVKVWKRTG